MLFSEPSISKILPSNWYYFSSKLGSWLRHNQTKEFETMCALTASAILELHRACRKISGLQILYILT